MADPRVSQEDRERIDEIAGWAYDLDEAGLGALAKMFATVRAEEREAKDRAYSERNKLAVLLAALLDGTLGWHEGEHEDGWDRVLFFTAPGGGQVSFHIAPWELESVLEAPAIKQAQTKWDGHDDSLKWARIRAAAIRARKDK